MSHANVYRHFPSKAALQEAVAARWLHALMAPLTEIANQGGDAATRLEMWLLALHAAKRRKVVEEPEMFATYMQLAQSARAAVAAHLAEMEGQVAKIIAEGAAATTLRVRDPQAAARMVLGATMRFHHPHFVAAAGPNAAHELRQMVALLLGGLRSGVV